MLKDQHEKRSPIYVGPLPNLRQECSLVSSARCTAKAETQIMPAVYEDIGGGGFSQDPCYSRTLVRQLLSGNRLEDSADTSQKNQEFFTFP